LFRISFTFRTQALIRFYTEFKAVVLKDMRAETLVTLLNTTIRYVRADTHTALPYARSDSYAFVLYFRLRRTREADEVLHKYHTKLADLALACDGSFYLPYRLHYSDAQLRAAYPNFDAFAAAKAQLDPLNLFTNTFVSCDICDT
jgi:FAD/FMN-containing dehydrogenase